MDYKEDFYQTARAQETNIWKLLLDIWGEMLKFGRQAEEGFQIGLLGIIIITSVSLGQEDLGRFGITTTLKDWSIVF